MRSIVVRVLSPTLVDTGTRRCARTRGGRCCCCGRGSWGKGLCHFLGARGFRAMKVLLDLNLVCRREIGGGGGSGGGEGGKGWVGMSVRGGGVSD